MRRQAIPWTIAEYLGRRTDTEELIIPTAVGGDRIPTCPFMGGECSKLKSEDAKNPVCAIRGRDGVYVVCADRLIPAKAKHVTPEHKKILREVSETLFVGSSTRSISYRRQIGVRIGPRSHVYLDYVIQNSNLMHSGPTRVILEVQGGGETNNTGTMSRIVRAWASEEFRTNEQLIRPLAAFNKKGKKVSVNPIPNNAWKRQLDQVLLKVQIAQRFGGSFALATGTLLFEYLQRRGISGQPWYPDWQVALLEIVESPSTTPGAIPFKVGRPLFTSYEEFITAIREFELPEDISNPFVGTFLTLEDVEVQIVEGPH